MNLEELRTIFYTERELPEKGEIVVAEVISFTDDVVHCVLPMYARMPVILPTRHINMKRGKKVKDYVKVGRIEAATIYEIHTLNEEGQREIDLSIKSINDIDISLVKTIFYRAEKVHNIVCHAAQFNREKVIEYYKLIHRLKGVLYHRENEDEKWNDIENDTYSYFQLILLGKRESPSEDLYESIKQRMPVPTYTVEKDIRLNTIDPNGVKVITDRLNEYVRKEGTKVYIVAPPVYKVTATARTKEEAEEILATL